MGQEVFEKNIWEKFECSNLTDDMILRMAQQFGWDDAMLGTRSGSRVKAAAAAVNSSGNVVQMLSAVHQSSVVRPQVLQPPPPPPQVTTGPQAAQPAQVTAQPQPAQPIPPSQAAWQRRQVSQQQQQALLQQQMPQQQQQQMMPQQEQQVSSVQSLIQQVQQVSGVQQPQAAQPFGPKAAPHPVPAPQPVPAPVLQAPPAPPQPQQLELNVLQADTAPGAVVKAAPAVPTEHPEQSGGLVCVICQQELGRGGDNEVDRVEALACAHTFHAVCLAEWRRVANRGAHECPFRCHVVNEQDMIQGWEIVESESNVAADTEAAEAAEADAADSDIL